MRNVNIKLGRSISVKETGFILTMRNVNDDVENMLQVDKIVLY